MPISDPNIPTRPPPDRPDPEPEPPTDEPGWIDPGLQPNPEPPTFTPEPEPEPEYEPVGFLLLDESELSKKYQTYGGTGLNCGTRSTDWSQMSTASYWLEGAAQGRMQGSTLSLISSEVLDSWMPTNSVDSVNAVVAENAYVNLNIHYSARDAVGYQGLEDTSFSFSVCLEAGDSLNASVGESSVLSFSVGKNGVECLNYSEFSAANAIWSKFTIAITIEKAYSCSPERESEPDQWTQEDPIDDGEGSGGSDGTTGGFEWTQSDSWVLLGGIVIVLLVGFVMNTTRSGDCD